MYTSGNDRFCYLFLVQMLITCKYSARQRLLFPVQLIEGISLKCLFTQGEIPKCFRTAANHLHMVPDLLIVVLSHTIIYEYALCRSSLHNCFFSNTLMCAAN